MTNHTPLNDAVLAAVRSSPFQFVTSREGLDEYQRYECAGMSPSEVKDGLLATIDALRAKATELEESLGESKFREHELLEAAAMWDIQFKSEIAALAAEVAEKEMLLMMSRTEHASCHDEASHEARVALTAELTAERDAEKNKAAMYLALLTTRPTREELTAERDALRTALEDMTWQHTYRTDIDTILAAHYEEGTK